ncbi:MAG: bifunctional aspartate transaminase/aspartate 4-decarboxylase [Tannerellaceae bacterium]|nr:bifunctional aspartate transaminase/aspartate 4-decarboxylase [Tannerellaceae bacterium]
MEVLEKLKTTRRREQELEQLSPFELKDNLIKLAEPEKVKKMAYQMLNAGRGNPNWIATTPREAFFTLGKFGLQECCRTMKDPSGMAGIPQKEGIGKRFEDFLKENEGMPGIDLLKRMFRWAIREKKFNKDEFAMELAEGIIGDQYPVPDRMLKHTESIVHDYLMQEMCNNQPTRNRFDLFAVEGGTAAICYIFDSLMENGLLKKGDRIALGVPAFTPYLEMPHLDRYDFDVAYVNGSAKTKDGQSNFQYPEEELDKLGDKTIKAFFITNPSNPTSVEICDSCRKYLVKVVKHLNPNLMVLTDDVYGTFVNGFVSLMRDLPRNTICVYSFSKYFGCTGWRLGVIAINKDNIYDDMISALPESEKKRLNKMYESLSVHPEKMKFIDRMVADSRQVALNHTAGLSLPQQMQMMLFASFALLDKKNIYKEACQKLLKNRFRIFWEGMHMQIFQDPNRAGYYCEIDIHEWAENNYGEEFVKFLENNFEPVDIVFRLAEKSHIVLLNGGGFAGPEWSVRVSLANLNEDDYRVIGEQLSETMNEYLEAWKASVK